MPRPTSVGRLAMNSSMLSWLVKSRIAKKNVSAHRTVEMSTGFVKRTTAVANGDTNSLSDGCVPSRFGSGTGVNDRKYLGSSPAVALPAANSATHTDRGAFATSHGSRSDSDGG